MLKVVIYRNTDTRYCVIYEDKVVCKNVSDPEHCACRYLQSIGCTGKLTTYWAGSDVPAMILDIERDAKFSIVDTDKQGLRRVKYVQKV